MFRISTLKPHSTSGTAMDMSMDPASLAFLSEFYAVDRWSASLDNALLTLGADARCYHGLDQAGERVGLLDFVRSYDERVHHQIIGLFEQAAARGRPFHYSAELRPTPSGRRLVVCLGDFRKTDRNGDAGELHGVFLFSREHFVDNQDF